MEQRPTTFQVNGAAVRWTRMSQGLTQAQVAEAAGITANYLSRLETGTRQHMRPGNYAALRTALNANDAQLLAHTEDFQEER